MREREGERERRESSIERWSQREGHRERVIERWSQRDGDRERV